MRIANLIIIILTLSSTISISQERIKLFYNADWKITSEEKAQYYRLAEYDLNNFKLDGIIEDYTLSHKLILKGNYLNGKKSGDFTTYFANGQIKQKCTYENNRRLGKCIDHYRNGQIKQVIIFNGNNDNDFSVMEFNNEDGVQFIVNGTGEWQNDSLQTGMFDRQSYKTITGKFKNGLKHGDWKLTRISDGQVMQTESFSKGKFIVSKIYQPMKNSYGTIRSETMNKFPDSNNMKFRTTEKFELDESEYAESLIYSDVKTIFETITGKEYKTQNREAGYIYGDLELLDYIQKNIRIPKSALTNKVNGTVLVRVTIDELGKNKSVTVLKGVTKDLDNEALRLVKSIEDWLPTLHNGQPIESTITIPVTFKVL